MQLSLICLFGTSNDENFVMKLSTRTILSYHPNKSSGLGGIETLIRSLHKISRKVDKRFIEHYNFVSGDSCEYFKQQDKSNSEFKRIYIPSFFSGKIKEICKSITFTVKVLINSTSSHVIIYSPSYSIFLFSWVLRGKKLVIVQSNKLDVLFECRLAKISCKYNITNWHKFVVYTDQDKLELNKKWQVPFDKIAVIPRGCKLKTSDTSPNFSTKLVTIARIEEKQKNFIEMINIIDHLPNEYTLDIYGSGCDLETSSLKSKIDNNPRVKFCGVSTDVASTLSKYSLFIMTSRYEGFGQTLIEARSQGLPIVVYNTFLAAKTIVKNGSNGFLVEPYNTLDFVNAIKLILGSEIVYSQFSQNSLSQAFETEQSSVDKMWSQLLIS